jgi:hypothetical protein
MAHLCWQHFLEYRPIAAITEAAKKDFEAAQELCGPKTHTVSVDQKAGIAHYRRIKPGQRKPHRDTVGDHAA